MKKGFTLIELLVVVLIIGILSAVALPKYEKAVKRSKGVEARVAIKTWADALNIYYLENSEYPDINRELPLEEASSILGIDVSPLKYFYVGCENKHTNPISCVPKSCSIYFRPNSGREASILCYISEGKSIDFSDCASTVGYSTAEDYGIKQ